MAKQSVDCAVIIALREEFLGNKGMNGIEEYFEIDPQSSSERFRQASHLP